jgi:hypothetical protein
VNGGSHGLERFVHAYETGARLLQQALPVRRSRGIRKRAKRKSDST